MSRLIAALLICSFGCGVLTAADPWPTFRGPTADGHYAGQLPVQWSAEENVIWRTPIPGEGWSSPVIGGDRIYLTAAVPVEGSADGDRSLSLVVIDASGGEVLSVTEVFRQSGADAPKIHPKNSHASPTAILDGPHVFVHFGHQGTACLTRDGSVVWRNGDLKYKPVHGNGGTPLLVDDVLIFSCDGADDPFIVALDKATGDVRWKRDRQTDARRTFSFSTPTVLEVDGQKQVISPGSNTVDALDPVSGELIWNVRYEGYSVIPKPIFGHGLVFICSGYDRPKLLAVRPAGSGDITESHVVWTRSRGIPHTPSLLLVGNHLYGVSDRGVASCVDAATGRVHWEQRVPGKYSSSPIAADGKVYFLNEEGLATIVSDSDSFERVAENDIGERTLASFAAASGDLFIRGDKHLYRIGNR